MTAFPDMIRNVAVVGHLHHGKTALMDMLVFETHKLVWDADQQVRTPLVFPTQLIVFLSPDAIYRHAHSSPGTRNIDQIVAHISHFGHNCREISFDSFH
jgi:hypothetical protein